MAKIVSKSTTKKAKTAPRVDFLVLALGHSRAAPSLEDKVRPKYRAARVVTKASELLSSSLSTEINLLSDVCKGWEFSIIKI